MQGCLVQWVRSAKTPSGFPADRRGARGRGVACSPWRWRDACTTVRIRTRREGDGGNAIAPTESVLRGVCGSTSRTRIA